MNDLLPCPFCGQHKTSVVNPKGSNTCFVYCWECSSQGPKFGALAHGFEWANDQAIIAWNCRRINEKDFRVRQRREFCSLFIEVALDDLKEITMGLTNEEIETVLLSDARDRGLWTLTTNDRVWHARLDKLGVKPTRIVSAGRPEQDIAPCYEYQVGTGTDFMVTVKRRPVQSEETKAANSARLAAMNASKKTPLPE